MRDNIDRFLEIKDLSQWSFLPLTTGGSSPQWLYPAPHPRKRYPNGKPLINLNDLTYHCPIPISNIVHPKPGKMIRLVIDTNVLVDGYEAIIQLVKRLSDDIELVSLPEIRKEYCSRRRTRKGEDKAKQRKIGARIRRLDEFLTLKATRLVRVANFDPPKAHCTYGFGEDKSRISNLKAGDKPILGQLTQLITRDAATPTSEPTQKVLVFVVIMQYGLQLHP